MVRNAEADPRLRTNDRDCDAVAGGYPDWLLYRRGRIHDTFDSGLAGGRSEREPMVIAGYGPTADGRAIIAPALGKLVRFRESERTVCNPMSTGTQGEKKVWFHLVLSGLDFRVPWSALGAHVAESHSGGPVTAYAEDCRWAFGEGGRLIYLPRKTTIRRSVIAFSWNANAHNQGYYTSEFGNTATFDEVIFYRNGYKTDPRVDPDPRRDIFSRNIYQGGGANMGHRYLGIISADGGSGGPQMRLGGEIEGSLIVEGYWFSAVSSNQRLNPWLVSSGQSGRSALVRNNVQLVFAYPTPLDPDTDRRSAGAAQPGWGYQLHPASFGAVVEGNIVSQAMLIDELGVAEGAKGYGIQLMTRPEVYQDGKAYTQQSNTIRGNILYRSADGLQLEGDWAGAYGNVVESNVFVARNGFRRTGATGGAGEAPLLRGNRFYTDAHQTAAVEAGNSTSAYASAAATEHWPDPNRTLKRYVAEVAALTLLDWKDDPFLDGVARDARVQANESYDPTGLKTFMAVATNMRRGGTQRAPTAGKPSWTGDYAWDERFTGRAVVNWIRAGFGLPPVGQP
jgi:hypothetical protein